MTSQIIKERKLTTKQEAFCFYYAADERFFGNATKAYIKAYGIDVKIPGQYAVARQGASSNLSKSNISNRINQLLEDIGLTDEAVDKQLAFVIQQHGNLQAKVAGIKEYNNLKKRTQGTIINNGIALILEKYGLTDAGQTQTTQERLPENTTQSCVLSVSG